MSPAEWPWDARVRAEQREYQALYLLAHSVWLENNALLQGERNRLVFHQLTRPNDGTPPVTAEGGTANESPLRDGEVLSDPRYLETLTKKDEAIKEMSAYCMRRLRHLSYLLEVFSHLPGAMQQEIHEIFSKKRKGESMQFAVPKKEHLYAWAERMLERDGRNSKISQETDDYHNQLVYRLGILKPLNVSFYLERMYEKMRQAHLIAVAEPIPKHLRALERLSSASEGYGEETKQRLLNRRLSAAVYRDLALKNALEKAQNASAQCSLWDKICPPFTWDLFLWILISPLFLLLLKVVRFVLFGNRRRRQREAFRRAWTQRYNRG